MTQAEQKMRINEMDFAIYELELFLDTHPYSKRAMDLLKEFRAKRGETVTEYETNFGKLVVTTKDVVPTHHWNWIDSPWPWEIDFLEG